MLNGFTKIIIKTLKVFSRSFISSDNKNKQTWLWYINVIITMH